MPSVTDNETWPWQDSEVMISYASKHRTDLALLLHSELEALGSVPRLDRVGIDDGRPWRGTIHGWLDSCDAAIALLDEAALQSPFVRYEINVLSHRFWQSTNDMDALLLVRLGGVSIKDIEEGWFDRGEGVSDPARLAELQSRNAFESAATDEEICAEIVERLAALGDGRPVPPSLALTHRALSAVEILQEANIPQVPLGRSRLALLDGDGTINRGDPTSLQIQELQREVAKHLCMAINPWLHGLKQIAGSFEELAPMQLLLDLNFVGGFDGTICSQLLDIICAPGAAIVLACLDSDLAAYAVRDAASRKLHIAFDGLRDIAVVNVTSGESVENLSTSIASSWTVNWADEEQDDLISTAFEAGDPLIAIVNIDGAALQLLQPTFLDDLRAARPEFSFVFTSDRPEEASSLLGIELVGPAEDIDLFAAQLEEANTNRRTWRRRAKHEHKKNQSPQGESR